MTSPVLRYLRFPPAGASPAAAPSRRPLPRLRAAVATLLLALAGAAGLAAPAAAAYLGTLNASWEYQANGGDEEPTQDRVLQKYYLTTGFTLYPTDAITTGADLAYSRYHITDIGTTEVITPTANFELRNDLFVAAWEGTYSQSRFPQAATLDTYTWEASLSNGWQREYWPNLKLYYGGTGLESDDDRTDQEETSYGLDLTWSLPAADFYYGFNQRNSEDHANLTETDATSHFARLETGGTFLDKRLVVKLIETFNHSSTENTIGTGGGIDLDLQLPAFAAVDADPGFVAHAFGLTGSPFRRTTIVHDDISADAGHLSVQGVFGPDGMQQVNQLRIGVDDNTTIDILTGQAALHWALYVSTNNLDWEPVPGQGNVIAVFDSQNQRFEIEVPALTGAGLPLSALSYDFLKVVAVNQGSTDVVITSVRAIRFFTESDTIDSTTWQTDLNLSYRITQSLVATSTLMLLYGDDSSQRDVHATLRWTPSPYAGVLLGFSDRLSETDELPDLVDRTYTISVPVSPLPTLNVTLGATRTESYTDSERTSQIDSYTVDTTALIYPDLKAGLSLNYNTGDTDEFSDLIGERENFSARASLLAFVTRALTVRLEHEYQQAIEPLEDTTQSTNLNVVYRPSDLLITRLIVDYPWDSEATETIDFKVDLALVRSQRTRLNLIYRHLHTETESDAFGLLGSWDISEFFTLQTNARYIFEEENSWTANVKLLLNI